MRAIDDEGQIADRTFNIVVKSEYILDNSLRFNDDDSAYLSRTPSSAGNRKTWTWSGWVKLGNIGIKSLLFGGSYPTSEGVGARISLNRLDFFDYTGTLHFQFKSDMLFRDPSAWYHIVIVFDTTQSTSTDRIKIYVNGSQITASSLTSPSLNYQGNFNNNTPMFIGSASSSEIANDYSDGYLAEVHFIDGQALNPTAFGKAHDIYGHWVPTIYSGTYGTNGFFLNFGGNIAYDQSGNGNNWIANNIDLTNDFSMLDTPTNNFSTINPLDVQDTGTISEGNLKSDSNNTTHSTMGMSTGKWYWETFISGHDSGTHHIGIHIMDHGDLFNSHWDTGHALFWPNHGGIQYDGTPYSGTIVTYSTNDIISVALDLDNRTISMYKNNTVHPFINNLAINNEITDWLNTGNSVAAVTRTNPGCRTITNFGQDSSFAGAKTSQNNADGNGYGDFYYAPPTGFNSLCTRNLPDPTVVPGEHFNVVTYAGDDSPIRTISGVGFQPGFTWVKDRVNLSGHYLWDEVRGTDKNIRSDGTWNETDVSNASGGIVSTSTSDGFITKIGSNVNNVNGAGNSYVAWNWKANGAGVSNTNGSITSTVSANAAAGFSIVGWTGNGVDNSTIGHGLSSPPDMIITKKRNEVDSWNTYHKDLPAGHEIFLDQAVASSDDGNNGSWGDNHPSSVGASTYAVGYAGDMNATNKTYIAYCFHSVDGYSKMGSYKGNSSTDGAFVYTGFAVKYVMVHDITAGQGWWIFDNERDTNGNPMSKYLGAERTATEYTGDIVDFVSNGFKLRHPDNAWNVTGDTYIFMAFAEYPFKHSNAR
jgi:hypothetical protein